MHSETTQVIHEHAAPTHIKESGNTSDLMVATIIALLLVHHLMTSATIYGFSRAFVTHSSKRYIGTFTSKEKSAHHESSQKILQSPPHSYKRMAQTPICASITVKGSNSPNT